MPCPSRRYKEAWGPQRCLLCLDCALLNRAHAHNCTHTHNAVCGECVQGFYRKTRLGGFQDSECVSCASSPPADRTQCGERLSVVRVSRGDSLSEERAVTGVVCGVLATVLVAVSAFCLVYWKHHLAQKQQQQQQLSDGALEAQEVGADDDVGG
ncbi:tumor necrosis factor receptor superfamily member 19-like [Lampetra planeri]